MYVPFMVQLGYSCLMDMAMDALQTLREMSDVELSRRSGVSRSTLHRIETGAASPTLRTLRELAIAAGVDIDVSIKPLSDPSAGRAARFLLDSQFRDTPPMRQDRDWMERLTRVSGVDPEQILAQAGHASSLLHAPSTMAIKQSFPPLRLASAGDATGQPWALSGRAGLSALSAPGVDVLSGPDVLYVADPHHAWRLLESPPLAKDPATSGVLIAPWREEYEVDLWQIGPVSFVAPIQILLDSIGLGEPLSQVALEIARGW
jgi:transcriptional regulator with XRE-family HTH domain